MVKVIIIFALLLFTGCATYTGDTLVSSTSLPVEKSSRGNLLKVESKLLTLYDELKLPKEREISLEPISTYKLIQENKDINFVNEKKTVFLIDGNVHVSYCNNAIVVASGNIDISHSSNNILISGKNVEVSHDRGGSIIVANGRVDISFANNTTVYASGGLEISHARNVISYNTDNREISWGHVNNILIEPLFKSENKFDKSLNNGTY